MKTISDTELDNLIDANKNHDLNGNCYAVLQALTELKALRHPAPRVGIECYARKAFEKSFYPNPDRSLVADGYGTGNWQATCWQIWKDAMEFCGHPIEAKEEKVDEAKVDADIATHAQMPKSCGNCIGRFDSSKCRPAVTDGVCANKDEYRPKVPDAEPWIETNRRKNHVAQCIQQLQRRFDALQREMREGK